VHCGLFPIQYITTYCEFLNTAATVTLQNIAIAGLCRMRKTSYKNVKSKFDDMFSSVDKIPRPIIEKQTKMPQ